MKSLDELLSGLPALVEYGGTPVGCDDRALDGLERWCGFALPALYREFALKYSGAKFEESVGYPLVCRWFEWRESLYRWMYVVGDGFGAAAQRESRFDVQGYTETVRGQMEWETAGLGTEWSKHLVAFGRPSGGQAVLLFDYSFCVDGTEPAVVLENGENGEWAEPVPEVIRLVAPSFRVFLELLRVIPDEDDSYLHKKPTPLSDLYGQRWEQHVENMLGGHGPEVRSRLVIEGGGR